MHDFPYWTYYHAGLVDGFKFRLISSRRGNDEFGQLPLYNKTDTDLQQVIVAGTPTEEFGPNARVLIKYQHSPGFGILPFINGYRDAIRGTGSWKFMMPRSAFDLMLASNCFSKSYMKLRDRIVEDPRAFITNYDLALNELYNHPRIRNRVPGLALVACNWRLSKSQEGIRRYLEVIDHLYKFGLRIRCHIHPMGKNWHQGAAHYKYLFDELQSRQANGRVEEIRMHVSRLEMIAWFDECEYIVSDGSGSLYEAVSRGCKGLTLSGLPHQRNRGQLHAAADGGFLAPIDAMNISAHHGYDKDFEWLRNLHGESLVHRSVKQEVQLELEEVFDNW